MTTVSPNYQQRGQFNPFYVMKSAVIHHHTPLLSKKYKEQKFTQKDLFFKCVDQGMGELIYSTSSISHLHFNFQLMASKENYSVFYKGGTIKCSWTSRYDI